MALGKDKALELAKNIFYGPRLAEAQRLNRIHQALSPRTLTQMPNVEIPHDAPNVMKRLAVKSSTNFLPLVVDTFSQGQKVDGYYTPNSADKASGWAHWQRNGLDARQTGVHRAAMSYGAAYATVLPGDKGPVIRGLSPRRMTAIYQNPADDDWAMSALDVDGSMWRLFDEEMIYYIGAENVPTGTFGSPMPNLQWTELQFIEARPHNVGETPIVRFRDRMLLDGEEQYGLVEPLLTLQARIDETTFGQMVTQYYEAFKQRYVVGWVPKSEEEHLKTSSARVWYFEDDTVKPGEFTESDVNQYITSKASAIRDLAAIGQIPAQNLGVDGIANISPETLAGLEAGKDRKNDEIETSLGESWEQTLRLAEHIAGNIEGSEDFESQVKWKDQTARSFAQTVDGLGKLGTMLHIPDEVLWSKIPGWTQQDVEEAKRLRDASPSDTNLLIKALDRQALPTV